MARNRASAKKAGTAFETELSRYLTEELGVPVKRRPKSGAVDLGDLMGVTYQGQELALECKSPGEKSSWSVAEWWKETVTEAENLGAPFGLLFVRRYRKPLPQSLVVIDDSVAGLMTLDDLTINAQKALGFKALAEKIGEKEIVTSPKRGEEGWWYFTTVENLIPCLDCDDDAETIFLDDQSLKLLKDNHKITLASVSGGIVTVKWRAE